MGLPVLIMGESGSGKTFSLRNFEIEDVSIFSIEKSRLPFQKKLPLLKNATYSDIEKVFLSPLQKKAYVIDDSQYLLVNESFDKAKETGFGKWTDIALHFRNLIHFVNRDLPEDVIVYFLHHTEQDGLTGKVKAKTIGKLLDNQLTVEGCFDIVLLTQVKEGQYSFITQTDGYTTAKSPYGMFESTIPNDLKAVDTKIRSYYGYAPQTTNKKTKGE
ncbi:AAA family ATPase [Treponema pectinovorum]|uniref:AAA family ATPase n=1 Tax=Treponema pectinovorum TaxID=164 RepID=UPI0011CB4DA4|nr:AAA family ATPase [Treponema pectinovorum]